MTFPLFTGGRAKSAATACAAALTTMALTAPAAHAGFVFVGQSGSVSATVTDSPDAGGAVVDSNTDSAGLLSRSASADDGAGNSALSTQSVLDDGFTGTIHAQSAGNRTIARSILSFTFDVVDEAYDYDLSFVTQYDGVVNPDPRFGSRGSIKLTSLSDASLPPTNIDLPRSFLIEEPSSDLPPSPNGYLVGQGGALQVGRYRLDFDFTADSIGGHSEAADFSLKFSEHHFGDPGGGGGDGGNPPPAVPLPPAAWASLATFGMMGAGKLLRRRTPVK